jgi:hypothetical protein
MKQNNGQAVSFHSTGHTPYEMAKQVEAGDERVNG